MMTVLEYAIDMNKQVNEVLKVCQNLGIKVTGEEDILDDDAITQLDIVFNSEEAYSEDIEEEDNEVIVVDNKKMDTDSSISNSQRHSFSARRQHKFCRRQHDRLRWACANRVFRKAG